MDGLTFMQTKGAPLGRGALNVRPMHELTLPLLHVVCGLSVKTPWASSFPVHSEVWRPSADSPESPSPAKWHGGIAIPGQRDP